MVSGERAHSMGSVVHLEACLHSVLHSYIYLVPRSMVTTHENVQNGDDFSQREILCYALWFMILYLL
jgi:hypothetical protein